jgi:hypothetical protein
LLDDFETFFKNSMPLLEIWIKNKHPLTNCDLFSKDHASLWCMHWSSNKIGMWYFMKWSYIH